MDRTVEHCTARYLCDRPINLFVTARWYLVVQPPITLLQLRLSLLSLKCNPATSTHLGPLVH